MRPARPIVEVVEVAMQEYSAWRARVEKRRLAAWRLIAAKLCGIWAAPEGFPEGWGGVQEDDREKHSSQQPTTLFISHSASVAAACEARDWHLLSGIGGLQRAPSVSGIVVNEEK